MLTLCPAYAATQRSWVAAVTQAWRCGVHDGACDAAVAPRFSMPRMQHGDTIASVACAGTMLGVAIVTPKQTHMELSAAGFIRVCDIPFSPGHTCHFRDGWHSYHILCHTYVGSPDVSLACMQVHDFCCMSEQTSIDSEWRGQHSACTKLCVHGVR